MRVVITGANGLLGRGMARVFSGRHDVIRLTRAECDITNASAVRDVLARVRPDAVIHTAAIRDLDVCEADPDLANRVNVEGTQNVAAAAKEARAAIAYISTDAVFDGLKQSPYTEADAPNPETVYGKTKVLGEGIARGAKESWVFRIPVLYGPGKENFISKGLSRLARGEEYAVAADQVGGALYTLDGAAKIMEVMEAWRYGTFHLTNTGICSRLELAQRAAELAGMDARKIIGKPSDEMGQKAKRLKYAVMEMTGLKAAGFALPRPWQEALEDYVHTWRQAQ